MTQPIRLGVMISGSGRTLMNLLDQIEAGSLSAQTVAVIASRRNLSGTEKARARGLEVFEALQKDHDDDAEALHDAIDQYLTDRDVDLVCLAGYLRSFRVSPRWQDHVINIHPALLPDFGGPGMYGEHVHRAVLESGRAVSGCTVHFVDEHYDRGPIILQRVCPVLPGDTADTLAARVFERECEAYPAAIEMIQRGLVTLQDGRVQISRGLPFA